MDEGHGAGSERDRRHDRRHVYIGGRWVESASARVVEVYDSVTEEVMGCAPEGHPTDVDHAVEAARAAFDEWAATPVGERAALMAKAADGLAARADELTTLITRETGMPVEGCRVVQVGGAVHFVRVAAEVAVDFAYEERIKHSLVVREPVGVVGAIAPWNFPLNQMVKKVAYAMAAGCTVVAKPSEVAPLDAYVLTEVLDEIGLPPGVFNLVPGIGPTVGQAMSAHPDVDMVSLTGSTASGTKVMQSAATTIKRVGLELGGKSANILLDDLSDDAFRDAVSQGVQRAFMNGGQICAALTRMLVPQSRLDLAEEVLSAVVGDMRVGDPFDPATVVGPLASAAHRDRVVGMIRAGLEDGAALLVGGPDRPEGVDRGYYVRPTVFTRVDNSMRIAQEEIFGPVLCLIPYRDDADAVRIANDSQYGLSGGVWSADVARAELVARRIRTGAVYVNGAATNVYAPFGGYKRSGIGREYGRFGFEEYLQIKSLHLPS
ncbi:aldehyde dehydrogenase family protein [Blastococcus sp. URHD0036]|uniref:aldehyde dehydrogenase family protein n=1 Tax=Blastococcus sp. URHD0036 TaxID=1380356 RepID=UPI00068FB649|nr:aldehyde dehydrogenase family protein [Blastococcus sp. URHD0036]